VNEWLSLLQAINGALLGWLIDPESQSVYVYRPGQPTQQLESPDAVMGDPESPGFRLEMGRIWEPDF
jgi:Uma2 family endonuclease